MTDIGKDHVFFAGKVAALLVGAATLAAAIEDPDDVTPTARIDESGATVRAARFTVSHAADSCRNADFTGHERLDPDRFRVRSNRLTRNPTGGSRFRIKLENARAGEAWALHRLVVHVSAEGENRRAADTTSRTNHDAATEAIPSFSLAVATDDARNAGLSTLGASVQERRRARFSMPASQMVGSRFRIGLITDGRAGGSWALDRLVVWVSAEGENTLAADTTSRTDADAATTRVAPFSLSVSADDVRNAALQTIGASVQDRRRARFAVPSSEGKGQRFRLGLVTDGRAGNSWALDRLIAWVSAEGDHHPAEVT